MRKNQKLIRKLLVFIRDHATCRELLNVPMFNGFDPEEVEYHLRLCEEDGFIVLSKTQPLQDAPEGTIMGIVRITSTGHDQIARLCDG